MAVSYFKYIDGLRSHYVSTIYAEACCSVLCFLRLSTRIQVRSATLSNLSG